LIHAVLHDRSGTDQIQVAGQELGARCLAAAGQSLVHAQIQQPHLVGSHAVEPVDPKGNSPVQAGPPGRLNDSPEAADHNVLSGTDNTHAGRHQNDDDCNRDDRE
jgi:hypothetical protein